MEEENKEIETYKPEEKEVEEEEEPKERRFRLPWKSRVGRKKAEKGWSTIALIRNNGTITFSKVQVKDGIGIVDGFPRIMTIDHKLTYKGKPLYIIPEWSLKPFSPAENYSNTEKEKMNIAGRRAVLAVLETEKIKPKKDFGSMAWILIAVAVLGGLYYLAKSLGWV